LPWRRTFWTWQAVPYILYTLLPAGTGAAIGLLPGVAAQYRANGDSVAWMNGLAGGLLLAAGALSFAAVSWLLRRMRLPVSAIVLATFMSLVNAFTIAILWLGHLDPRTYFVGVMLYLFTSGMCYASSIVVFLEFMGDAGTSGSTRYSLINSLGNVPVQYMILVDGWGCDHFGMRGLAGTECVVGIVAAVLLLRWLLIRRPTLPADAPVMCLPLSGA